VLALMDALQVPKAALVGWSDGGIIGLDIAIRHPERLTRLFAFGANSDPSAIKDDIQQQPAFSQYSHRNKDEYQKLSPAPNQLKAFSEQLGKMEDTEPISQMTSYAASRCRPGLWTVTATKASSARTPITRPRSFLVQAN
jgi:pimeloyl-ACP methyl ester carboxylesterase